MEEQCKEFVSMTPNGDSTQGNQKKPEEEVDKRKQSSAGDDENGR